MLSDHAALCKADRYLAIDRDLWYNSQGKYHSRRKEKTTAQLSWL
jgi:hypothetical protein